jgi:hypothetical protein
LDVAVVPAEAVEQGVEHMAWVCVRLLDGRFDLVGVISWATRKYGHAQRL